MKSKVTADQAILLISMIFRAQYQRPNDLEQDMYPVLEEGDEIAFFTIGRDDFLCVKSPIGEYRVYNEDGDTVFVVQVPGESE